MARFWLAVVLGFAGLFGSTVALAADSESWDAVYLGSSKVGHIKTVVKPVKDGDRQLVNVRVNFFLNFKRGRDNVTMEVEYGTIETPDGEILRLDTRTYASQQTIRVYGDVIKGKMRLKLENGDQKQEKVIDWSADTFGPYGVELSLSRKPMKAGESRDIKMYLPDLNKVTIAHLKAVKMEKATLGGGARDLLRVESEMTDETGKALPEFQTTYWIDEGGQVMKSFTESNGGLTTYRTTREGAMKDVGKFDLLSASIVKIGRKIAKPENTRSISYRLTLTGMNATELFPTDRRQTLKPRLSGASSMLDVATAGPEVGDAGPETVEAEYLESNPYITSSDPTVARFAREAVGNNEDPWAKAQAITHWVATKMKNKNFQTGFAPADEVARTLAGDCTEHAVLTAAMCRAQGVPARVATGLVYANDIGGFGFHMWNEVYVNRRWVAIDSAFDQTSVDAVHLKLSDSSLNGVSPFDSFTSVSRVFGKLKIEVIEIR